MTVKTKRTHRILSAILCLTLLMTFLPLAGLTVSAGAASSYSRATDPDTLNQWKQYFGIQTNHPQDVALSTEFAGGVWTDKSVFAPTAIPNELTRAEYKGNTFSLSDKGDNFLVSLSAIASNKEITGYSTVPTVTVLVLDLSSSMRSNGDYNQSAIDDLAAATNNAIQGLLELNKNNRIGVVLYAGNVNQTFSAAEGTTQVLLPLDTYELKANGRYLESIAHSGNADWAIRVADGVTGSNGAVTGNKASATGTFMQDGIYEAMKLFLAAEPTVKTGVQAGTQRLPIMVLMTDGEPTLANNDYDGNAAGTDLGQSVMHDFNGYTSDNTHRDTIAFMTMLTAAYAKKQITAHYGDALLYTLAYGEEVTRLEEARSVMDPQNSSDNLNELWNAFLADQSVTVYRSWNGRNWSTLTTKNATSGAARLTAADKLYVDKYFPATSDAAFSAAFADIVDEIIIQSKYYPTYVEKDHDHDGYLTFVDKIGKYMDITDIKGIVIGDRLFSGAAMASALGNAGADLGTVESPTDLGNNFIWSVKERLGIENTATARALVADAYKHGQLAYQDDQNFSHYIGWFSDADGNYLDFWHAGMTAQQIQEVVTQKGATHIMKSYGFLGDTTVIGGVSNTDMMYMTVRIATEIASGESILTWQLPASLIPTVTYEVSVNVDADGNVTEVTGLKLEDNTAESPIRLLYEVELKQDIYDWNLTEKVPAAYANSTENKEAGYVFYTNKWTANADDTTLNTYSHFEPSDDNERYYYTEDSLVYTDEQGTVYTGAKPANGTFYRQYTVYEKLENGQVRAHQHYEPITAASLDLAEAYGTNQWVIPKGTIHRYYDFENSPKADPNATKTMNYSDHPFIVANNQHYYTYSTQGNNGKLTATPATGIKLTKTLAEGFTSDAVYTFVIEGNINDAQVVRLDDNGLEAGRTDLTASGEVTLKAGETVYIVGLTAGTYTVKEKAGSGYHVKSVAVNGQTVAGTVANLTIAEQTVTPVEFVNDKLGRGDLIVSKDVNYPEGFEPNANHDGQVFTIQVEFTGDTAGMTAPAGAAANGNVYTVLLKNGESVTFRNIPEGVTYNVTEGAVPAGYRNEDIRYSNTAKTITPAGTDQAHVVNRYEPAKTTVNLKVNGTKTVSGGWPDGAEFTMKLYEITDFANGTLRDLQLSDTVTKTATGYEIDLSSFEFTKVGTYNFLVQEEIPAQRIPDMAYDRSYGLFSVVVTDADADGALEVSAVNVNQDVILGGDAQTGYTVTKDFHNAVTKDIVYLNVTKTVEDLNDSSITYTDHAADITFGLFESMTATDPVYYVLTDAQGKATFAIPVTQAELGTAGKVYYLREIAPAIQNRVVGMKYDENWIGALSITWDDANHEAIAAYAAIENGAPGAYAPYTGDPISHKNYYTPDAETTALQLSGVKTLNGGTELGGRTFSFSLYQTSAAFVIQGSALQTVNNNGNAITFAEVPLTTTGLHYFSVKENATTLGGVSIDENHYHVTVLVEKTVGADGITRLHIADGYPHIVAYGSTAPVAANALNFNNTYAITGNTAIVVEGTKTLTGRPLLSGEFTFRLTEVADAQGTAIQNPLILTAENGTANGDTAPFRFQELRYDQVGTHYYKVEEVAGANGNGVTYAENTYIVKVEVTDNTIGGLDAAQTIVYSSDNSNAIAFKNTYQPAKETIALHATKELTGRVLNDGEFEFTIVETERDFTTLVQGGLNEKVQNNGSGGINFPEIEFTTEDVRYFVVQEVAGSVAGVTYDESKYLVTVSAEDNQKGALVLSTKMIKQTVELDEHDQPQTVNIPASSIVFANAYQADALPVRISGLKKLENRTLAENEFKFFLYEANDAYAVDPNAAVKETTNKADGTFAFEEFTLDKVGTYYFVVAEDPDTTAERVTNDTAIYHLAIEVKDDANGKLYEAGRTVQKVGEAAPAAEILFTNVYTPKPEDLTVEIVVKKKVVNKGTATIGHDGFEFILENTDTTERLSLKSDKNGIAAFVLGYTENDIGKTFIYKLTEVNDGREHVQYSTATYAITVSISRNANNELVASFTKNGEAATNIVAEFENVYDYTPDPTPTPDPDPTPTPDPDPTPTPTPDPDPTPTPDPETNPEPTPDPDTDPAPQPEADPKPETEPVPESGNPDTGDHSKVSLWITLLCLSGMGIFGLALLGKKKKEIE